MIVRLFSLIHKILWLAYLIAQQVVVYGYRIGMGRMGDSLTVVTVESTDGTWTDFKSCPYCLEIQAQQEELRKHVNEVIERLNELVDSAGDPPAAEPENVRELMAVAGGGNAPSGRIPAGDFRPGQRTRPIA